MSKRKSEDEIKDILNDTGLPVGWVESLKGNENLPIIIAHLINVCQVDERAIKRAKITLPSFSKAKWKDIAEKLGFPENPSHMQLPSFSPPSCFLPPSFHESCFVNGWQMMDVFSERLAQDKEAARVKLLDPVSRKLNSQQINLALAQCS